MKRKKYYPIEFPGVGVVAYTLQEKQLGIHFGVKICIDPYGHQYRICPVVGLRNTYQYGDMFDCKSKHTFYVKLSADNLVHIMNPKKYDWFANKDNINELIFGEEEIKTFYYE